jgi:hypothetical protein
MVHPPSAWQTSRVRDMQMGNGPLRAVSASHLGRTASLGSSSMQQLVLRKGRTCALATSARASCSCASKLMRISSSAARSCCAWCSVLCSTVQGQQVQGQHSTPSVHSGQRQTQSTTCSMSVVASLPAIAACKLCGLSAIQSAGHNSCCNSAWTVHPT